MKSLGFQQKIAIMRILFDIINADGRIDVRETFYYNKISELLGLKEENRNDVNEANSLLCLLQISQFDDNQKQEMAKMMGQQIVVDEDININEMAIYNLVCKTCGIDIEFEEVVTPNQIENSTRS
jgi:uncharacterized tellurite resistance protein B-like protein